MVEQSSFPLIALFWLKIGRCRGRNWLYGNQALVLYKPLVQQKSLFTWQQSKTIESLSN